MELPSFYRLFFLIISPRNKRKVLKLGKHLLSMVLSCAFSSATLAQIYTPLQLKHDIASFLANEYQQQSNERVEISVGNLDNRLRLSHCSQPLSMKAQDPTGLGGNISVQAQCKGNQPWSVYVPAQVFIYQQVPVALRDLARGDVISAADIRLDTLNISAIRQEFVASISAAVGKEVKRNISQGEPLKSINLDAPTAIKRGETVTVQALAGDIRVSSSGTAMADGRMGQKIRIRNNQSERVVTAVVIGPGQAQAY